MTTVERYLDDQKHNMVYYDKQIYTLNNALRRLYLVSNPILKYKQFISLQNPYFDLFFQEYIHYDLPNQIINISFPPQCSIITNIKNNYNCRMVTYFKDPVTNFIKEIQITPRTNLNIMNYKDLKLRIYTEGNHKIIITFTVYLFKNKLQSLL
jgi:hypothetical protein